MITADLARRWRSLRLRTRVALALLAIGLPALAWSTLRAGADDWPARSDWRTPSRTFPIAISPDGRTVLSSGEGGITPWDSSTGRKGTSWSSKASWFVRKGAYSPDGRTFAAVVDNAQSATIELIDPGTGRTRATLGLRHPQVYALAFADDGRTLRAFLGDGPSLKEAVTWDVATAEETSSRAIGPPNRGAYSAISPDGRLLAFIPNQPTPSAAVQLWDLEADRALGGLTNTARSGFVGRAVVFSPDGRTLAVAREDSGIDLWDVPGRKLLRTLTPHPAGYVSWWLWFSPDGRTLASTALGTSSGSPLARAFDDLGRRFLGTTPGLGSELVVVDLAKGQPVVRTSSSMFLFYAPDGRSIVTRKGDLSVQVRDLPGRQEARP